MDHSFNPIFAQQYGMVAAVIIHDFAYWIRHNSANRKNYHEGRYWTYNSAGAFQSMYPYMGKSQIYSAINKMLENGLIVKGNFNKNRFVHIPWYSITDKGYEVIKQCEIESAELQSNRQTDNQTGDIEIEETTTFENCDEDVSNNERGRLRSDASYIYSNRTILNSPDTYASQKSKCTTIISSAGACEGEEPNPFGDREVLSPNADTVQMYAVNNLATMGARAMEELNSYCDDLTDDVVRHAIDNALDAGVRNWSYVKAILNRYADEGIKTVGAAKEADEKRKSKGKGGDATPSRRANDEAHKAWQDMVFGPTEI